MNTPAQENVAVEQGLEPCPFCGGEATLDDYNSSYRKDAKPLWGVGCESSECPTESCYAVSENQAEAIAAWNSRTPSLAASPPAGADPSLREDAAREIIAHLNGRAAGFREAAKKQERRVGPLASQYEQAAKEIEYAFLSAGSHGEGV